MSHTIGIQGQQGSYHEVAAKQLRPEATICYYNTFADLFRALKEGQIDHALAAVANNRVQFIPETYEYLTDPASEYTITGEIYLPIRHALLGIPGTKLGEVTEVHSQIPAIGQCTHYIERVLPHAHVVEEVDTALSAKLVQELGDPSKVAIASEAAGKLYGLVPLATGIQNDQLNITRFIELAPKRVAAVKDADKTTVLLHTPQTAGALVGALEPFKEQNINISSLQSRLIPNSAFDMLFFMEFDAGMEDARTHTVLDQLLRAGYVVQVLGSYKSGTIPMEQDDV